MRALGPKYKIAMENRKARNRDILLGAILLSTMTISIFGSMAVTVVYIIPGVLGLLEFSTKSREASIIGVSLLFTSQMIGYISLIFCTKLISLFLVDEETFVRWRRSFQSIGQISKMPLLRIGVKFISPHILWAMKPK
jgi:hypothetical protein